MSKSKTLTLDLVFNKTKSDNLHNIKNLNLWGNELEDLSLIQQMPNLEVISLSVNHIATLKYFSTCQKLQELYLRKNCISDLTQIRYLTKLPALKVLWLHDNPCANVQNYREIVIHHLPNLSKLDNNIITEEERTFAKNPQFQMAPKPASSKYQESPSKFGQFRATQEKGFRPMQEKGFRATQEKVFRANSAIARKSEDKRQQPVFQQREQKIQERNWNEDGSQERRNKNILLAVLSLMKELDPTSLELVVKQGTTLINGSRYK